MDTKLTRAKILILTAFLLFFFNPLVPDMVIAAIPSLERIEVAIYFLAQCVAAFLLMLGIALQRQEGSGVKAKNIWELFTPAQRCLELTILMATLAALLDELKLYTLGGWAVIAFSLSLLATCVFFIMRVVENAKMRRAIKNAEQRKMTNASRSIASSKRQTPPVPSLARPAQQQTAQPQQPAKKPDSRDTLHTKCATCGEDHPESEMFYMDNVYVCQTCFRVMFEPDLDLVLEKTMTE